MTGCLSQPFIMISLPYDGPILHVSQILAPELI